MTSNSISHAPQGTFNKIAKCAAAKWIMQGARCPRGRRSINCLRIFHHVRLNAPEFSRPSTSLSNTRPHRHNHVSFKNKAIKNDRRAEKQPRSAISMYIRFLSALLIARSVWLNVLKFTAPRWKRKYYLALLYIVSKRCQRAKILPEHPSQSIPVKSINLLTCKWSVLWLSHER